MKKLNSVSLLQTNINSIEFIKELPELMALNISGTTTLTDIFYNCLGEVDSSLNVLKNTFEKNSGFRQIDISGTGISSEEVNTSGIRNLNWQKFSF